MLSIVTDPLQSSCHKHQIMSIISNNYHAIFISLFTASVVILSIYWTSKYYQQTDITDPKPNDDTKTPVIQKTNRNQNQNQKQKQKQSHVPPDIQLNHTPISIQKQPQPQPQQQSHEHHQHKHKHKPLVPSPNPSPIQGIPAQIDFCPQAGHHHKSISEDHNINNQPHKPAAFTPFEAPPVFPPPPNTTDNNNNNGTYTIMKSKRKIVTITYPNQEPITIEENTEERIDIPHTLWSPFVHGLRYAVAQDQGSRRHMENSTSIVEMSRNSRNNRNGKTYSFSLFDGHLGDDAAKFCTEHLHEYVQDFIGNSHEDDIVESIRKAFHHTDVVFEKWALDHQCEAGAVGVYVYYECNAHSTDSDNIYVANVGDCRAILCSKGSLSILTEDHNPKNEDEKKRCGHRIDCNSDLLSGQVSVTRAIGDYYKVQNGDDAVYKHAKLDGLICDPHIIKHKLSKDDEFLIIACDGLWDIMDSQNAMTECRRSLRRDGDVTKAAEKLIRLAKHKSGQSNLSSPGKQEEGPALTSDNISVMVIGFADRDPDGKLHIGPKLERLVRRPRRRLGGFKRKK